MNVKLLSLAALFFCGWWSQAAEPRLFDLRPPARATVQNVQKVHEDALRTTRLPSGLTSVHGLSLGDRLTFRLWDDLTITLVLSERLDSPLGGESFLATVEGRGEWQLATVLETAEGLQVEVQDFTHARVYRIVSTKAGVTVEEIDSARGLDEPAVSHLPKLSPTTAPSPSHVQAARLTSSLQPASTLVDILFAYDANAFLWAQNNGGGVTNFAQQAVAKMNACLANNALETSFRFRLVGVTRVSTSTTDIHAALRNVQSAASGWEGISAAREAVGADIVCTLIDTGAAHGVTGVGFSLPGTSSDEISQFSDWAYCVLAVRAVATSQTATHEVGHIMGCGHTDQGADVSNRGPQSDDWSRGYYFKGTDNVDYHTVMAYNSDGYGNMYTSAPIFSSPNRTWKGTVVGDLSHDNERVLRTTFAGVANYHAQVIPMSYDVFFAPDSRTLFDDSLAVTLTPGKEGATIRYTLDGSTPTATTGLVYQGPFMITATTKVRAATITDGIVGPIYEATYFHAELGTALTTTQLTWETSDDYPWYVQTTDTYDGECAVQSTDGGGYWYQPSWISTHVTGPTQMSFRYKMSCHSGYASLMVTCDSQTMFQTDRATDGEWRQVLVDVPAGQHMVKFNFECQGGRMEGYNGVWLDTVQFDVLSQPPLAQPETTADVATACTFFGQTNIVLSAAKPEGLIYYTLDGSDPTGEAALPYTGPITLTRSTLVQAVELDPGREPSVVQRWLYLERHPIQPGEWTTDVDGVRIAAAKNGKLVCVLLANLATCWYCQRLDPIAQSYSFTQWAASNGVYLVTADASVHQDADAAGDWFWDLYRNQDQIVGGVSYPTMFFVTPKDFDTPVAHGLARSGEKIGSATYADSLESLIAGFSSVLSSVGITPTAYVPPPVSDILGTQGITWANTSPTPWQEAYPAQMKAGGLMNGTTYVSVLTATVSGKGRFVFTYEFNSYSSLNTFDVKNGKTSILSCGYNGKTGFAGTVTNIVNSSGNSTFTFTLTVGDPSRDYSSAYSTECAAWLSHVQWIPEGSSLFPTLDDLTMTFGSSSDIAQRVNDAKSLAAFNTFLSKCGLKAPDDLNMSQRKEIATSFALAPYLEQAVLFEERPNLCFKKFQPAGANWDIEFSLETPQKVSFVPSRVGELVRVGLSPSEVTLTPVVVVEPITSGKTATLTIAPPSPTRGFMRLVVP